MAGLYKDFDEIEANCPDSIYGAIKYMKEEYDYMEPEDSYDKERAIDIYISTMSYMELGSLYDKSEILEKQHSSFGLSKGDRLLTKELPKEYDRQSETMCLSLALHLIHQKFPDAHEQAIDCLSYLKTDLAHEKGIDIDKMEREVYFEVPEHLTGKSAFPEYLDRLIEEKLDGIREDLYIEKSITWAYSHLDQGLDYDYSNNEYPYVTIKSLNSQSLDMAEKRLNSITDREISDKKEVVERERVEDMQRRRQDKITEYAKDKPEPYFENKYCSCYKEQEIPKDLSSYTLNPDRDGFTPMFTISTPETNIIYLDRDHLDYELEKELIPEHKWYQSIGDCIGGEIYKEAKFYHFEYVEIKDDKEFKDRVDKCMDKLIERDYDKDHEINKDYEKDIEIPR